MLRKKASVGNLCRDTHKDPPADKDLAENPTEDKQYVGAFAVTIAE